MLSHGLLTGSEVNWEADMREHVHGRKTRSSAAGKVGGTIQMGIREGEEDSIGAESNVNLSEEFVVIPAQAEAEEGKRPKSKK
mmetsp:Transcript_15573/g.39472  ORF Transcript_15573/g.39472 Transcript_15573/m.39472 type:complete len:83 (+) Transcript_15573:1542-1790(+)